MTAPSQNDAHLDEHVDVRILLQIEGHLHLGGSGARIEEEALPIKHLHRHQLCHIELIVFSVAATAYSAGRSTPATAHSAGKATAIGGWKRWLHLLSMQC